MRVYLSYFPPSGGEPVAAAEFESAHTELGAVVEQIVVKRRIGELPGLRRNSGRNSPILIAFGDGRLHLAMPPFVDDEDHTPIRVPTQEMPPLERPPAPPREDDK